jgi:polynucleotide 5'-kinase involved in rRNA processing
MPLRLPGTEFWPSLKEQDEKRRRMDEIRDHLSKIDQELAEITKEEQALNEKPEGDAAAPTKSQEEISERRNVLTESKGKYEAQLAEEKEESIEIRSIPVVKEKDRLNIIILGPKESGKTTLAKYLA